MQNGTHHDPADAVRPFDDSLDGSDSPVRFNVGGRIFEVMPHVIRSRGQTLLGNLLDDIGTDGSQPIFVDANPDRFPHMLDWYRYGEIYVPEPCCIEGVLRDARYFMLPDVIRINGEPLAIRGSVVAEVHEALRHAVLAKWPNFRHYVQKIVADIKRSAELLGDRSSEVDTDMFDSLGDVASESASTQHVTYCRISDRAIPDRPPDSRRMCISKEIILAEVGRLDDTDSNMLEVQSMAPMFMFSEAPPPSRWRWIDEQNVCNELRLRVLKDELERMGFSCTICWPKSREQGVQRFVLKTELTMPWQL